MTLPLQDCRILITRSPHQASELATRLEALGATTILIPTIEIVPPVSFDPLDDAIAHLDRFDWLVFTSANAVEVFKQRSAVHVSPPSPHILTAVIGPATARAAAEIGLNVALMPPKSVAESLASSLLSTIHQKSHILLIRAETARDHLPTTLTAAGIEVTIVEAYRTVMPETSIAAVKELFTHPALYPQAITFTSSSTAANLLSLLKIAELTIPPSVVCASIGPITTKTLQDHAIKVQLEADEATTASLVRILAFHFEQTRRNARLPT